MLDGILTSELIRKLVFWGKAALLVAQPQTFLIDVKRSDLFCSSPYLVTGDDFTKRFSFSNHRASLIQRLREGLNALRSQGLEISLLIIGGSFLNDHNFPEPRDLDCVIYYSLTETVDMRNTQAILAALRKAGIDARLFPIDSSPIMIIKSAVFFTNLYENNKSSENIARGSYLLDVSAW